LLILKIVFSAEADHKEYGYTPANLRKEINGSEINLRKLAEALQAIIPD